MVKDNRNNMDPQVPASMLYPSKTRNVMYSILLVLVVSLTLTVPPPLATAFPTGPGTAPRQGSAAPTGLAALPRFRARSRVVRDPKTGFYRPAKSIELPKPIVDGSEPSLWDQTKEGFYGAVDGVTRLAEVNPLGEAVTKDDVVEEGYRDVEQRVLLGTPGRRQWGTPFSAASSTTTPDQRLVREYQRRNIAPQGDTDVSRGNLWTSIKGAVYSGIDLAAAVLGSRGEEDDGEEQRLPVDVTERAKPKVRETIASPPIQKAIADLELTSNPIQQAMARRTLDEYQRQRQEIQQKKLQRQQAAESIKQTIFGLGDAVSETIDVIAQAPAKVTSTAKGVSDTLQRLPQQLERSQRAVMSVPNRIKETTGRVQSSIEATVESTVRTAEEIAMIPTRAQESMEATRESITSAIQTVDEVATKAKVLVGLEKPVPKPPKMPPPKPATAKEIGLKVAKGMSKGLLQLSWWAGKEAVILSWKGAKLAVNKGVEAYRSRTEQVPSQSQPSIGGRQSTVVAAEPTKETSIVIEKNPIDLMPTKTESSPSSTRLEAEAVAQSDPIEVEAPKTARSVTEEQADIDRQVDKALRLAEEALGMATTQKKNQEQS